MTETRPEPVLDAARLAGLILGLVLAVVGVVRILLEVGLDDLSGLELATDAAISAGGALAAYLVPLWQARKARAKVTPLDDPRDADGEQLVPVGTGGHGGYVVEPQVPGVADHAAADE